MRFGLYDRFWVEVAAVLSVVGVVCGWPAFQRRFGFPASLLWTLAVVAGVWITYLIRAYVFRDRGEAG